MFECDPSPWFDPFLADEEDIVAASEVIIADGPNLDAFGRLRISNPIILFDCQLTYDKQSLIMNDILAAGGSVDYQSDEADVLLQIDTTVNASAIRQSKAYHRYRPGHSLKVVLTFNLLAPVGNVSKRVGYFDANDGIFLQQAASGAITLVRRTSVSGLAVDNGVAQASWNIDIMDGNGVSGLAIDWSLAQNMIIDLQALYVGRVRVGFYLGGKIRYVHEFNSANQLTVPYIRTANLPVRFELTATGAAAASAELKEICSSVVTEAAGELERGYPFSANTGVAGPRAFSTTPFPVLAVRPKATFNGLSNHGQLIMEALEVLAASGAGDFRWRLIYNPTITGGAWTSVHADSIAEFNITATAMSGGVPIQAGYLNAAVGSRTPKDVSQATIRLPWVVDGNNVQIPVAIECTDLSGNSEAEATLQWRELR